MRKRVVAAGLLLPTIVFLAAACSSPEAPDYPDAFDPRIADLVGFAEAERGLVFLQQVPVDFLDKKSFVVRLIERDERSEEDLADLENFVSLMRALGLLQGEVDILDLIEKLASGTVLAFYDIERERIVIRSNGDFTARTRATLVHELTHALQDQHFNLDLLLSEDATGGEKVGLRALSEADAERIEDAFVATFDAEERAEYERVQVDAAAASEAELDDVPPSIVELFVAEHVFGPPMLDAIIAIHGKDAGDAAFRDSPG